MGSGQSGPKITSQDRAILDLKLQRDRIRQYQRKTEGILEQERQVAREALAVGNKARALTALRRRKYQEQLLVKTDNQLETLQNLVTSIEFSLVEKDVLFGLRQGNAVLKELNKEMTLESVEKLMGETANAVAYQKEVDEMLSSLITADDEEEVQRELAQLEAEQLASTLPQVPAGKLPTTEPAQEEEEEPIRERPVAAHARHAVPA